MIYCAIRFGSTPNDFLMYEFYRKSNRERKRFITYRKCQRILRKYNPKNVELFKDKVAFNQRFRDYVHREWLDMDACTPEEFAAFVRKHHTVILKPARGGKGKGVIKFSESELDSFSPEDYQNHICEEILVQHPAMSAMNPSSVNTIRVLTFRGQIIACVLRSGGQDSIVDNISSNGIGCHLDIETGIVDTRGRNMAMDTFLFHPSTGCLIPGFRVPHWEAVKQTVRELGECVPDIQYVGWDIAILEDTVAVIEGNNGPGHHAVQMIAQTGLYDRIKEIRKADVRKNK